MFLPFVLLNSLTPLTILFDYFDCFYSFDHFNHFNHFNCFVVLLRCCDYSDFRQFRSFLTLLTASFYHTKKRKSTIFFFFVSCFATKFVPFCCPTTSFQLLHKLSLTLQAQALNCCPWQMYLHYTDTKCLCTNSLPSTCRCHRNNSADRQQ